MARISISRSARRKDMGLSFALEPVRYLTVDAPAGCIPHLMLTAVVNNIPGALLTPGWDFHDRKAGVDRTSIALAYGEGYPRPRQCILMTALHH